MENRDMRQPELPGPGGYPLEIPDDLHQRLWKDIDSDTDSDDTWTPLEEVSETGKSIILRAENSIRKHPREHLRVFDLNGGERYRKTGEPDRVPIDLSIIPGQIVTHNHPRGLPPSIQDILVGHAGSALEIRVVTGIFTYAIRFPENISQTELKSGWDHLSRLGMAVGWEWSRSRRGNPEDDTIRRALHAALMELARRGVLKYRRDRDV
ncbi:hypothetical protein llg_04850 [Luteolibacter sp. LG18]|nr:hypothetical protein llg_04850 [Luteolibacter sp. LG18]